MYHAVAAHEAIHHMERKKWAKVSLRLVYEIEHVNWSVFKVKIPPMLVLFVLFSRLRSLIFWE